MKNFNLKMPFSSSITLEERQYLYFGGTAYLGIPQHASFLAFYLDGITKFGLNNGTSRNNNIQLGLYDEAECYAAAQFGAASALIASSGYLAAQLTVKFFCRSEGLLYAPQTHPALWAGQKPTTEGNFSEWARKSLEKINTSDQKDWVLISNSLNNLFPEHYDFSFIKEILPGKSVILIIDDSHGIGILDGGKGIFDQIPKTAEVEVIVVASMAKALGLDAGIILGSEKVIRQLKTSNEFLGASPPAAAGLYAFMQAEDLYRQELEKLLELSARFASQITPDWQYVPGFPVFYHPDGKSFERLLAHSILISSFPYPDPKSEPVNRVVLSSWHTEENINQLILAL
ncbi:7-keto-8-aminopelargonate synthetase [Pedobacter steynii]|uniref:7-keto-8-aminopelargonate synthetase n=1 Tax=Pedobacter steynii TaxID=430522 RepID=A0A1H0E2S3_9SPHI|nr:aminotransferase class I/II-fold pyridoxal phosphate-dependent enzyme [Pedobacter steynii]NQX41905.1 aminotransferase class I/II-fold pyridoxal phosphate-dependent enzyme [Pedobacter steynii]SDN76690.1 7-keto-8-aminopelargonate synthetase [Pedobacter steynii]